MWQNSRPCVEALGEENLPGLIPFNQALNVDLCCESTGNVTQSKAEVAKLVYALDLGSSAARRESSSLSFRTIILAMIMPMGGLIINVHARYCRAFRS